MVRKIFARPLALRTLAPASLILACACAALLGGCSSEKSSRPLKMATTTSVANTGLLDDLLAKFRADTGIEVQFVAVGTGQALKHGENGDVDIVLVHAQPAEEAFVAAGFGLERVPVMWNDFVIAGPRADPAGIRNAHGVVAAFRMLHSSGTPFVSRADQSGTHQKELAIWKAAGITPTGPAYIEAGQGMEACLVMAAEKQAYVLTDRGTQLARADLDLAILNEGDPLLLNPYSLIAVNPQRYADTNVKGAKRLIEWMLSSHGQAAIAGYERNGRKLFNPIATFPAAPPSKAPNAAASEENFAAAVSR